MIQSLAAKMQRSTFVSGARDVKYNAEFSLRINVVDMRETHEDFVAVYSFDHAAQTEFALSKFR